MERSVQVPRTVKSSITSETTAEIMAKRQNNIVEHTKYVVFAILTWVLLLLLLVTLATLQVYGKLGGQRMHTAGLQWNLPSWSLSSGHHEQDIRQAAAGDQYLLGVGKADITGPVVELNMMGYADLSQTDTGVRQRLYSRAFIIGDVKNPNDRFVYLVLDTQSGDTAIRYGILRGLANLGGDFLLYKQQNVAVTGTHSHSGPGAWLNYLLPQITSKGFDKQSYQAIVDGAVLSIKRAHASLQPGYLSVGHTQVKGANINRSLYAYLANPASERAKYNVSSDDDGSVEKTLTLLKFQRASDGKNTGVLTWFPVHGTSLYGNNTLVTGDNKGVAADMFERSVVGDSLAAPGFVAGFSQANVGDTTPNVLGAWCDDGSGQMCSFRNSTCADGKSQSCHGRGPFFQVKDNGAKSCYEIGRRQYEPAKALYQSLASTGTAVVGSSVKSFHSFQDMSNFGFQLPNGTQVQTCPAALGYSFAAGTSDWPGLFDFTQNDPGAPNASPVWAVVSAFLKAPSEAQKRCQYPKPVLLDVGEITQPYLWTPNIADMQIFRVGQFVMIISPGEATTMAGRRWKNAIHDEAAALALSGSSSVDPVVVIGGPANSYTHYLATIEEYGVQRYEGASTLYGPHTLEAYINITLSYLHYLSPSSTSQPPAGPFPPDNSNSSLSFITGVVFDGAPWGKRFGDVTTDVSSAYPIGSVVKATFVGANPRNNLHLESTYAAVEKFTGGVWTRVRDDSNWSLIFNWNRTSTILGTSEVQIVWETEASATAGQYRFRYFGDSKSVLGTISAFQGTSGTFTLT